MPILKTATYNAVATSTALAAAFIIQLISPTDTPPYARPQSSKIAPPLSGEPPTVKKSKAVMLRPNAIAIKLASVRCAAEIPIRKLPAIPATP
uniref:Secreted protein n=1 Tax=Steinernema glaseri TaxID=37863 RepID=A0A1I7Y4M8_9BILA